MAVDTSPVSGLAAVPEDVPDALAGARFQVADGEVTRDR